MAISKKEQSLFAHEEAYRTPELIKALGQIPITVCGLGALGSNLVDTLLRQGFRGQPFVVIDDDRVERHNVGTQAFTLPEVGSKKAQAVMNRAHAAVMVPVQPYMERLTAKNVRKLLKGSGVVIDCFDNSESRRIVAEYCLLERIPCLHLGMFEDYGEIRWDNIYRVPRDVEVGDACDVPLARNLILMIVSIGAEVLVRFCKSGVRESYEITLRDFKVSRV